MGGITLSGKNNDQGVVIKGSGSAPIQNANVSPQTMVAPNYQTTATTSNQYYGGNIASPQAPAPAPTPTNTPTPDPWASSVWGSKGAYDQAVGDYNATKNNMTTFANFKRHSCRSNSEIPTIKTIGKIKKHLDYHKTLKILKVSFLLALNLFSRQTTAVH